MTDVVEDAVEAVEAVEIPTIPVEGTFKGFIAVSGECYWCGAIDKINRHFKKDKRVMSFGKKTEGTFLWVFPAKEPKAKREVNFGSIESVVVAKTQEVSGLISKTKREVVQILIRMMPKCGEKDFLLNLSDEASSPDAVVELVKKLFQRERGSELPCTDLRKETNAPPDLRDWLNQAGLKLED